MQKLIDKYGRIHDYLRVSLTSRCNMNCFYCNPKVLSKQVHRSEQLNYYEIVRLIELFVKEFGINKVRLTGGEPLMNKDLIKILSGLKSLRQKHDFQLTMTSNGTFLDKHLKSLKNNGMDRINISLDTLNREKFIKITGKDLLDNVLASIEMALSIGYTPLKINTVIMNDVNSDEIFDFIDFIKDRNINIRFIEYMPFANNNWNSNGFISYQEIKKMIESRYVLKSIQSDLNSVAKDFEISGYKGKVSFISSISDHFCHTCNRLRITSKGYFKLCLFSNGKPSLDLRALLNDPEIEDKDIASKIMRSLSDKPEKHASEENILKMNMHEMLNMGG